MLLSVKKIEEIYSPLEVWNISKRDIEEAIMSNNLESRPNTCGRDREGHIRRIAYLVLNGWRDCILMEPPKSDGDSIISDGNHRLAASIYLCNEYINVEVFGYLEGGPINIRDWASEDISKEVELAYGNNNARWVIKE